MPVVYPYETALKSGKNELNVVYNHGKVCTWDSFQTIRERLNRQWDLAPLIHNPISSELASKIEETMRVQRELNIHQ